MVENIVRKKKLLLYKQFSFSHSYISVARQNAAMCSNGLRCYKLDMEKRCFGPVQPITRRQILDSSKLQKFADDNFKFDENGRKLS